MKTVLFLCTGNSCRSQMAEAFLRALSRGQCGALSAGTEPKAVHPLAIKAMAEVGLDISAQHSKGIDQIPMGDVSEVITLCGAASDRCPALPQGVARQHWPLDDPAAATGSDAEVLATFRRVRDDIRLRVEALLGLDEKSLLATPVAPAPSGPPGAPGAPGAGSPGGVRSDATSPVGRRS